MQGHLNQEKVICDTVRQGRQMYCERRNMLLLEEHIETIKDSMSFQGGCCVLKISKKIKSPQNNTRRLFLSESVCT